MQIIIHDVFKTFFLSYYQQYENLINFNLLSNSYQ